MAQRCHFHILAIIVQFYYKLEFLDKIVKIQKDL